MIKKIAFISLVAAALTCGVWGYFYLQDLKKPSLKPFDVLPDSCSVLVEVKEPKNFTSQLTQGNLMWEEFLKMSDIKKLNEVVLLLDSLTNNEETKEYLGNEPFYAAIYGSGKTQEVVYAFNLSDVNEEEKASLFFEKNFAAKKISNGFYQCVLNLTPATEFYLYTESGLFVISSERHLIEKISEKNNKQNLASNKYFAEAYKATAKDKGLGLFIHLPVFCNQSYNTYFSSRASLSFCYEKNEKWIAADIDVEPSDINLQGFLPEDTTGISKTILTQSADDFRNVYEQMPYSTFAFEAVKINDYNVFCFNSATENVRRSSLKKYSDSLSADAQTEISSFIGNYMAECKTASTDTVYEYGLLQVADQEKAVSFFKATADSIYFNSDTANLFSFSDKLVFPLLTAEFFKTAFRYVSVMNEVAVFSNSVKGLAEYRKSVNEKTNLAGNERVINFLEKNFNSDLNYLYYSEIFKNKEALKTKLSENLNEKLQESPELFEKFDAFAFSLQKLKGKVFYKAHAGFNPKNKMYQNTLWEALADTDLYQLPVPVINHKTNETELICQDLNKNLYLLSNTGKILWKKNVQEKIEGTPVQIDYFANGKLQLLFVSENFIHLIDRNGNYVQNFPVRIKARASGGITVFDYDQSKNYRIWIPLKNNTVICLNNNCKTVEGFTPIAIKAPLAGPIQHLLLQQKDYFVLRDTLGNVYVTNRKGEERLTISNKLPAGSCPSYLDIGKDISKSYLCFADVKTKTFKKLSLTDKMETLALKSDEEFANYFIDTLQGGASPQIILTSGNTLEIFDFFGKHVTSLKMKQDFKGSGEALWFGDKKVYATLEKETGTLLLLDAKNQQPIENEIKLSSLPASYNLIKGQSNYLAGYYRNKIFCIKP